MQDSGDAPSRLQLLWLQTTMALKALFRPQRVYEAKRKGRNCVVGESADETSPSEMRPQGRIANG